MDINKLLYVIWLMVSMLLINNGINSTTTTDNVFDIIDDDIFDINENDSLTGDRAKLVIHKKIDNGFSLYPVCLTLPL